MHIFIRNVTYGKTMTFDFNLSDTIEYVKTKIQEKEKIPLKSIILIFCTKELKNDKILADYNITEYSTLHLNLKITNNKLPDEEKKCIEKETSEKEPNFSPNINDKEISIIIKLKIENYIPLKVKNINNIGEIKEMIESKENISLDKHKIIYNNSELDENKIFFKL